jgi:hypothetical protein
MLSTKSSIAFAVERDSPALGLMIEAIFRIGHSIASNMGGRLVSDANLFKPRERS